MNIRNLLQNSVINERSNWAAEVILNNEYLSNLLSQKANSADLATVATSGAYADLSGKPTKLSDFSNDSGFIDNTVNNLINYYLTSDTYTKTEVNNLIASIVTLNIEVVNTLPVSDISTHTIYLVPKQTAGTQDVYDEYINTDGTSAGWEHIGSTEVDLSNYYTKTEIDLKVGDLSASILRIDGDVDSIELDIADLQASVLRVEGEIPSDITDLDDVNVSSATNGQVLKYNNGTWENANESGGVVYTEGDGIDISANDEISVDTAFTDASTRTNIASGDSFSTILGKIKKFFADLKSVAFSGNASDLNNDAGFIDSSGSCASATSSSNLSYLPVLDTADKLDAFIAANTFKCAIWNSWSAEDRAKASYPGKTNGIILSGGWVDANYGFQIAIDDDSTWFMAMREKDGNNGWKAWKSIPMGDGTNASGSWNITAAHATVADDVPSWAKASTKPSYTHDEIGAGALTVGNGTNYQMFRTQSSWQAGMYYHTDGDEAMVFGNSNTRASWIFANTNPENRTAWASLSPAMHIKNGKVAIGKLIGNGSYLSAALEVNGDIVSNNIGAYSTATGEYKTATWATGTNTATWKAPAAGTYMVWMRFYLNNDTAATRNAYKQFQMRGTATRVLGDTLWYDYTGGQSVIRTISQPVVATAANQTIIPYVHTDVANMVFGIGIVAMRIK